MLTVQWLKVLLTKKWLISITMIVALITVSSIFTSYWFSSRNLVLRFTATKPITALAINNVTTTIALGHTDGTITLWG